MMSGEIIKNMAPNFGFAFRSMKHINANTTLNERLKQAGIKDNTPKEEGKGGKNKNSKKKKKQFKKSYSEDYMNNCFQRHKKLRKPLKKYGAPSPNKSPNEEDFRFKPHPESAELPQNCPEEPGLAERETIYVSLDFIEDWQNYQKKVRKPKDGVRLKNRRNSVRSVPVVRKETVERKKKPEPNKRTTDSGRVEKIDVPVKPSEEIGDCPEETPVKTEKETNEVIKSKIGKALTENFHIVQPFLIKSNTEDVAKIDKEYLNSLLSVTLKKEENENRKHTPSEYDTEQGEESANEYHYDRKKKITGRDYFQKKTRTREIKGSYETTHKGTPRTQERKQECTKSSANSRAEAVATRIVRDSTKSEEQIKLKKGKDLFENKSKPPKKNATLSKPDIKDIDRKKRKQRNKFMRSNVEEFIEKSLPSEVSKVADVKEIWRKKSESSLSSESSCTLQEQDEYPISKNLDSYRHLKKLVEEEIKFIAKKRIQGEVKTKKDSSKTVAGPKQLESGKTKPPLSDGAAQEKVEKLPILKRRPMQAGNEGKLKKFQLGSILADDIPKEANQKTAKMEETKKEGVLIPRKVIENWSILNRLEQAFLALGTPTFPDKNIKNLTTFRGKPVTEQNADAQKLQATPLKENKKQYKYKNASTRKEIKFPGNQISTIQRGKPEIQGKSIKKIESGKMTMLKEKHQLNKPRKGPEQGTVEIKFPTVPTESENMKKKKRPNQADASVSTKKDINSGVTGLSRQKIRAPHESQVRSSISSRTLTKGDTTFQDDKQFLLISNQEYDSVINLERKKTFDVIPSTITVVKRSTVTQGCDIDSVTSDKRFSLTNYQQLSQWDVQNTTNDVDETEPAGIPILGVQAHEQTSELWISLNSNLDSLTTFQLGRNNQESGKKERSLEEFSVCTMLGAEIKADDSSSGSYKDTVSRLDSTLEDRTFNDNCKKKWDITIDTNNKMSFEFITTKSDKSLDIVNGNINRDQSNNWNITIDSSKQMNIEVNNDKTSNKNNYEVTSTNTIKNKCVLFKTNSSAIDEAISSANDETNSSTNEEATSSASNVEATSSASNVEATSSASNLEASSSANKETNSSANEEASSSANEETNSSDSGCWAKERVVKKRSFLSVHVKQQCNKAPRTLVLITEKENTGSSIDKPQTHAASHDLKRSRSNVSVISTDTYDLVDISIQNYFLNKGCQLPNSRPPVKIEISPRLTLSSINNSDLSIEETTEVEQDRGESKDRRQRPLWEQDLSHYRAIVKDIMNQYKRIDGFLKQNEHLTDSSDDSNNVLKIEDNGKSLSLDDTRTMSIHEYRRRIASEYKQLPILEYKNKLRQKNDGNYSESSRKRNLLVVNKLKTGADIDVKDFQPNIQNILNSHLYVDTDRKLGKTGLNVKFKEKRTSLQDLLFGKSERESNEEWPRSSSTPKSFPLQRSHLFRSSDQTLSSQNSLGDSYTASEATTVSCQDTELENTQESHSHVSSNAERQVSWKVH